VTLLCWLLAAVVLPRLLAEFTELGPWLARMVVHRAAQRLPRPERSRWREQWLADLEDIPGRLTKLAWALSIFLIGAGRMRRLLGAPPLSEVLWARIRAAWQQLRSRPEPPQKSQPEPLALKAEVHPVTVTGEGALDAVLVSATVKKFKVSWADKPWSSQELFERYLAQHKREFDQYLAQQQQDFEDFLAREGAWRPRR
jgi:hypothetical protein